MNKTVEYATAPAQPLLRTKIAPVAISPELLVPRETLIERLDAACQGPLTLVCAPAGYGKSVLLEQYRASLLAADLQVAWLACDETDTDPLRVLDYLSAAIEDCYPQFDYSLHIPVGVDAAAVEQAIDEFARALGKLPADLYLLIDDMHRIAVPGVNVLSQRLVSQLPAHVHLIGSARSDALIEGLAPELQAQTFVLDSADLRFTAAQTAQYLQDIKQLHLSREELAVLHGRSEGWVTALQLLALALGTVADRTLYMQHLTGSERNIADYLQADVLADLPDVVIGFLQQTAVLDEFNAELCDALSGRDDSAQMLAFLQRNQLFVRPLEEADGWLRYHGLFADFNRTGIASSGELATLQRSAAQWCLDKGHFAKAIKYLLRAGDFARGAELLELHGGSLVSSNEVYSVLKVLKQLPSEVILEHAVFQIFYAWQLALEQRYAEAEALIEDVSLRLPHGQSGALHYGLAELMVAAQVLKALILLYQDKLESCLKVARHWLRLVSENQPVFSASLLCIQAAAYTLLGEVDEGVKSIARARQYLSQSANTYLLVVTSLIEALVCKEAGDLLHGSQVADDTRARVEKVYGMDSRVVEPLTLVNADLLYERNEHAQIIEKLPDAITWRDVATPIELISRGKLVMARSYFYAGDTDKGLAVLDDWLDGLHAPGYERVFALGMSCRVQFLLWLRRPNEAERTALQLQRHMAGIPDGRFSEAQTARVLTEARLALAERRADKAQAVLETCLGKHLAEHQRERRLHISLLLAVAHWRKGHTEKAFELFGVSLEKAWECGYRRMLLDDANWLYPLMDAWLAAEPGRKERWLAVAEQWREQCKVLNLDPDSAEDNQDVSRREREILRFVAAGLSNRDIAQAVHLSEATIKWHLHNLFTKLSVRSRTQAVLKGKSLGLLSEA